jgi:S1/P1 Nuclease
MIFMLAATWPDAIKRDPAYHNDGAQGGDRPSGPEASRNTGYDDLNRHKYWRFVDRPFSQGGSDPSSVEIPSPNAQTQIAAFRAVLSSTNGSRELKSYDLVWLLHLIGDVHLPLHCATRVSSANAQGDAGGNAVLFCSVRAETCNSELHAFGDDILGTSNVLTSADKYAAALDVPTVSASDIRDAKPWIDESFSLAQTTAYRSPVLTGDGPFRATPDYTRDARSTARKQVALAGARLAMLLETDLR